MAKIHDIWHEFTEKPWNRGTKKGLHMNSYSQFTYEFLEFIYEFMKKKTWFRGYQEEFAYEFIHTNSDINSCSHIWKQNLWIHTWIHIRISTWIHMWILELWIHQSIYETAQKNLHRCCLLWHLVYCCTLYIAAVDEVPQ